MEAYTLILMAIMVCREGAFEPYQAKLAIAQTVMDRADHPGWWGETPEEIITLPFQYSPMTDPKDKQLTVWPSSKGANLRDCLSASEDALQRKSPRVVKGADSFYSDTMKVAPKWAVSEKFVAKHGHHLFYNLDGK